MTAHNPRLTPIGVVPRSAWRYVTIACGIAMTIITVTVLAGCGGTTTAQPTANDPATIAAANTASVSPNPRGTTGTPVGSTRGFGGLLTPGSSVSSRTSVRPVTTAGVSTRGASSVASGSAARATLGPNASASSPALDACALLTGPEASTAMGEPYSQAQNTPESPASTTARLSGYSSASCVFAADMSTPQSLRAVQIGTLRRTPATNPPTGTGTYATIDEVWSAVTQQAQGTTGNPSVLMGVGDEAIVIDDTTIPGDEDVYARKGSVLLLVTVTGYDVGARDKAIAVATEAARNL